MQRRECFQVLSHGTAFPYQHLISAAEGGSRPNDTSVVFWKMAPRNTFNECQLRCQSSFLSLSRNRTCQHYPPPNSTSHRRRLCRSSRSKTLHSFSTNRSWVQPFRRIRPCQSKDVLRERPKHTNKKLGLSVAGRKTNKKKKQACKTLSYVCICKQLYHLLRITTHIVFLQSRSRHIKRHRVWPVPVPHLETRFSRPLDEASREGPLLPRKNGASLLQHRHAALCEAVELEVDAERGGLARPEDLVPGRRGLHAQQIGQGGVGE